MSVGPYVIQGVEVIVPDRETRRTVVDRAANSRCRTKFGNFKRLYLRLYKL